MRQIDFFAQPGGCLNGVLTIPGDKSISHRSIMLGALAEGDTRVTGFLEGEDSLATLDAFRRMGVEITDPEAGEVSISGVGMYGLQAPSLPLNVGNSGTSMRLLAGLLAGQSFSTTMTGDASLSRRPMRRVADPLAGMGALIETQRDGTPPLSIVGGRDLHGIDYEMPVASAQVKSSLLLAGMYADGVTRVKEPAVTRDHTERMLAAFSYPVIQEEGWIGLEGGHRLKGTHIEVPGDISSAAFFLVGALIAPGSRLTLRQVGINPTRTGIIDILTMMGGDIELCNKRQAGGEPVADIVVTASSLHGIDIPEPLVPLAIDEFPAIFIAAACASGRTRLTGASELRVKESDRIQVMADGMKALSIDNEPKADGIVIEGGPIRGGEVDSHGDHRIAMSFAMAALRSDGPIHIRNCTNVATSFPGFVDLAAKAGLSVREGEADD